VVTGGVNGFNAIEVGARLGGALKRVNQGRRVMALTRHLRVAELGCGAIGGGRIQW
jgi:hypothetical protein